MKYFLVERNKELVHTPVLKGVHTFTKNFYEKLPKISTFDVEDDPDIIFPVMIVSPILLLKEKAKEIFDNYMPFMKYKTAYCSNPTSKESQFYYLPLLPRIKCLSDASDISESQGTVLKAIIKNDFIEHNYIFQIAELPAQTVVMRLDLIESLLSRGITEFCIKEVELC